MNTYNIKDADFINSQIYKDFMRQNPSEGSIRVRAYAASQAVPIQGVKITISTNYQNSNIVFFDGVTNESGLIERVKLPAPKLDPNNLDVPNKTIYQIRAEYEPDNLDKIYYINIYENVCVVQNINVGPNISLGVGVF